MTRTHVNMGEIEIAFPPDELICLGLGSCIAVILYEPESRIGGLAHVMLPSSKAATSSTHPGKFADNAVKELLKKMLLNGAKQKKIQAKIFGGANMFPHSLKGKLSIGEGNSSAVINELKKNGIPLIAKDIGGQAGRTIIFETNSGCVRMKIAKEKIEKLF